MRASRTITGLLLFLAAVPGLAEPAVTPTPGAERGATLEQRTIRVPGTTVSLELIRVPASDDGAIGPMWALRTEVPWELYDIFTYRLDQPDAQTADAIARPSKPYVPPDRGFGHQGFPAMGMTRQGAEDFCVWLSQATGIAFRLPTAAEWTHLAGPVPSDLDAAAWTAENANHTTHPVSRKAANIHGLHDMLGNVSEWVDTDTRRPVAMGGSYRDPADACRPDATFEQERSWNASDPQIPKSRWWLADCSWVGFRFVSTDTIPQDTTHDQ